MHDVVVLFDVDNTLLDNERVTDDLHGYLEHEIGAGQAGEYFALFEELRRELGYADYLGALQRFRIAHPHELRVLRASSWLVDYPFADRLYPGALDVLARLSSVGPTVILTDGDVVFQPRKIERSGILAAVDGRVLVYVHKERELADVERRFPARRYVLVDDKLRILAAVKDAWGDRLTTVFPRQGHYAHDPATNAAYPEADIADFAVDAIADLLQLDLGLI
ncbi:MAG: HAD family hydrolase [Gaiellaceae bacterium]